MKIKNRSPATKVDKNAQKDLNSGKKSEDVKAAKETASTM